MHSILAGQQHAGPSTTFTLAPVLTSVFAFVSPAAVPSIATFVAILRRGLGWIDGLGG